MPVSCQAALQCVTVPLRAEPRGLGGVGPEQRAQTSLSLPGCTDRTVYMAGRTRAPDLHPSSSLHHVASKTGDWSREAFTAPGAVLFCLEGLGFHTLILSPTLCVSLGNTSSLSTSVFLSVKWVLDNLLGPIFG